MFLASNGASGDILSMWDSMVVEGLDEYIGRYTVACHFKNVMDGFKWGFAGVYGPNEDGTRKELWDELAGLGSWWNLPWCIGSKFKITRFPSERYENASLE